MTSITPHKIGRNKSQFSKQPRKNRNLENNSHRKTHHQQSTDIRLQRNHILDLLKDINKRLNLTIVMITHQMEVVKEVCDIVAVIENGEIIEEGSMIDVFTDPQKPTTKDFVKSINNIELPALLQSSSISAVYTEGSKLIVRLSFIGNSAGDPIVSGMVKKFDVDINIIYGNIDSLKDIPFGTLVIEISGSAAGIKNALQYLHEQQLKVEVIGYVS